MIYNLNEKFTKVDEAKGVLENKCRHTTIELVVTETTPEKDTGIELQPKEKMPFRLESKQTLYARCTSLDGIMANLAVVNFNVPASGGSGAGYNIGDVFFTAKSCAPEGSLKADGSEISRDEYSDLFEAVGTVFGEGDGATTFNLPDLRGEFIRGLDDGRGVDDGRGLGTFQGFCMETHDHWLPTSSGHAGNDWTIPDGSWKLCEKNSYPASSPLVRAATFTTSTVGTFGCETRPRNIALLACIQYQ